jgi:hypothetical protein
VLIIIVSTRKERKKPWILLLGDHLNLLELQMNKAKRDVFVSIKNVVSSFSVTTHFATLYYGFGMFYRLQYIVLFRSHDSIFLGPGLPCCRDVVMVMHVLLPLGFEFPCCLTEDLMMADSVYSIWLRVHYRALIDIFFF